MIQEVNNINRFEFSAVSSKLGNICKLPWSKGLYNKVKPSGSYVFQMSGNINLKHRFKIIQQFGKIHKDPEEKMCLFYFMMCLDAEEKRGQFGFNWKSRNFKADC